MDKKKKELLKAQMNDASSKNPDDFEIAEKPNKKKQRRYLND